MNSVAASTLSKGKPTLHVSIDMGYGHLRAAWALAELMGQEVLEFDQPPLASAWEQRQWKFSRAFYESVSRASQVPGFGRPMRRFLELITDIPHIYPIRDQSRSTSALRLLEGRIKKGLGQAMMGKLREEQSTLLTTFYAPAIVADYFGYPRVVCVVTDSDVNRVWASRHSRHTMIHYCVPSERAQRRLRAYGVPPDQIHFTGFPLPEQLLGGENLNILRGNLAGRLVRLDPKGTFRAQLGKELTQFIGEFPSDQENMPINLTFAIGGAGAQVRIARTILPSLRLPIRQNRVKVYLVAGIREDVESKLHRYLEANDLLDQLGCGIEIIREDNVKRYLQRFNSILATTDILWTKPSELTFFGALGIPLIFSPTIGMHERENRRWALHRGAGFKQENPRWAWEWLREWLQDGTLAAAAWSAYTNLPKFGTRRILEIVERVQKS